MMRSVCVLVAALAVARGALAQPPPVAPSADTGGSDPRSKRDEALLHFERGLSHFDRSEWSAALAEFLRARELYPTRAATKNAAICMRHENRFDEALDMFEALVATYPDLSPSDRALAEEEIAELRRSVGALEVTGAEVSATIVIDGKERGTAPLVAPVRLSVGSHMVRVFKEGFVPFERRVEIASGLSTRVEARLPALARSGRLRVVESSGKALSVVVDGAVVGRTPWAGTVAPGTHSVLLRGEGTLGAQPVVAPVSLDQETSIALVAEALDASARIEPTPAGALVAVDGVSVGRGVWEGRVRSGTHRIEVSAEGFLPSARSFAAGAGGRELLSVALERDPTSPVWGRRARGHFAIEIAGARSVAPTLGGQVAGSCSASCSTTVPRGGFAVLKALYELPQGLGFGVEGGYLAFDQRIDQRAARIVGPALLAAGSGSVNDLLTVSGLLLGGSLHYRRGELWTFTVRVSVGAYLASVTDTRNGTFTTSSQARPPDARYSAGAAETHGAAYLYVAPEVRAGRRIGDHLEIGAGVQLMVLAAPSPPSWVDQTLVLAAPPGKAGDGLGGFGPQTLLGNAVALISPGLSARYDF